MNFAGVLLSSSRQGERFARYRMFSDMKHETPEQKSPGGRIIDCAILHNMFTRIKKACLIGEKFHSWIISLSKTTTMVLRYFAFSFNASHFGRKVLNSINGHKTNKLKQMSFATDLLHSSTNIKVKASFSFGMHQ